MNKDRLTGPGGFIDISQSTKNVVFMTPMTAKGLKVANTKTGLVVEKEGEIKKFVQNVFEILSVNMFIDNMWIVWGNFYFFSKNVYFWNS